MVPNQAVEIAIMRFLSLARAISVIAPFFLLPSCASVLSPLMGQAPTDRPMTDAEVVQYCPNEAVQLGLARPPAEKTACETRFASTSGVPQSCKLTDAEKAAAEKAGGDKNKQYLAGGVLAGIAVITAIPTMGASLLLAAPGAGSMASAPGMVSRGNTHLCSMEMARRTGAPPGSVYPSSMQQASTGPSATQIAAACRTRKMSEQWMAANCLTQ